jgi:hypothetical protein
MILAFVRRGTRTGIAQEVFGVLRTGGSRGKPWECREDESNDECDGFDWFDLHCFFRYLNSVRLVKPFLFFSFDSHKKKTLILKNRVNAYYW